MKGCIFNAKSMDRENERKVELPARQQRAQMTCSGFAFAAQAI